jgi:hypothetical protein
LMTNRPDWGRIVTNRHADPSAFEEEEREWREFWGPEEGDEE